MAKTAPCFFTPTQIADAFFTAYAAETRDAPQSFLGRAFDMIMPKAPRNADSDSLKAACEDLKDKGFSDRQVAIFVGVISNKVREHLDFTAQRELGDGHDSHSLPYDFNEHYFLGVKLDGERLDAMPGAGIALQSSIRNSIQALCDKNPGLNQPEEAPLARPVHHALEAARWHPL